MQTPCGIGLVWSDVLEEVSLWLNYTEMENSNSQGNQLGLALDLVCLGIKHNRKMEKLPSFLSSLCPSARTKSDLKEVERGLFPLGLSFCMY